MTIDEAIGLLLDIEMSIDADQLLDHPTALRLGIEALKRIRADRGPFYRFLWRLLPGETEA